MASTSYAKTLTSANHYTTVGELDNPVVQTSLTQQDGQLQSHKETNVSGGSSSQTYWTHSPAAVTASKRCNNHQAISAHAPDPNTVVIEYDDGCTETRTGGSRAWRNNNPGNIAFNKFKPAAFDGIGENSPFIVFPNAQTGFNAILSLLKTPLYQANTLLEAINDYAPSIDNNTVAYAAFVSERTGIAESTKLGTLNDEQIKNMAYAISTYEGWKVGTVTWQKGASKC